MHSRITGIQTSGADRWHRWHPDAHAARWARTPSARCSPVAGRRSGAILIKAKKGSRGVRLAESQRRSPFRYVQESFVQSAGLWNIPVQLTSHLGRRWNRRFGLELTSLHMGNPVTLTLTASLLPSFVPINGFTNSSHGTARKPTTQGGGLRHTCLCRCAGRQEKCIRKFCTFTT